VTDGAGQVTTTLYDADGRATQVTNPLGHSTQYLFDAEGRHERSAGAPRPIWNEQSEDSAKTVRV
jgi:uncharacterized protein RhaS with RHS repeats